MLRYHLFVIDFKLCQTIFARLTFKIALNILTIKETTKDHFIQSQPTAISFILKNSYCEHSHISYYCLIPNVL